MYQKTGEEGKFPPPGPGDYVLLEPVVPAAEQSFDGETACAKGKRAIEKDFFGGHFPPTHYDVMDKRQAQDEKDCQGGYQDKHLTNLLEDAEYQMPIHGSSP